MATALGLSQSKQTTTSTGTCSVCLRPGITMIKSSGLLRVHWVNGDRCAGHHQPPQPGSVLARAPPNTTSGQDATCSSHDATTDTQNSSQITSPTATAQPIDHPPRAPPILKRILRGARVAASKQLELLLRDVSKNLDNSALWERLFSFAPVCFVRPGRGGKSRNLTRLVKNQILNFDKYKVLLNQQKIDQKLSGGKGNKTRMN